MHRTRTAPTKPVRARNLRAGTLGERLSPRFAAQLWQQCRSWLPHRPANHGTWRPAAALLAGLVAGLLARPAPAQQPTFLGRNFQVAGQPLTLKDQLTRALRARRPEEFLFIEQVVQMVEDETLPLRMVRSSFLWSRNKRPYPMVYFEQSLRRQAASARISIP